MSKSRKTEAQPQPPTSTEAELPGTAAAPPETPAAQPEPIAAKTETVPAKTETPKIIPVDQLTRAFQLLEFADNLIRRQLPAAPSQEIDSIRGHWTNLYEGLIQEREQLAVPHSRPIGPPPDGKTVIFLLDTAGHKWVETGYYQADSNRYYVRSLNRFQRVEEPLRVIDWRPLPDAQ